MAWSSARVAWTYKADDGTIYRVAANGSEVAQAKQGGATGVGNTNPKPGRIRMRRVTCVSAANGSRVVPFYEAGAPIAAKGTTIDLGVDGVFVTFTSQGNPIPENHIRTAPVVKH